MERSGPVFNGSVDSWVALANTVPHVQRESAFHKPQDWFGPGISLDPRSSNFPCWRDRRRVRPASNRTIGPAKVATGGLAVQSLAPANFQVPLFGMRVPRSSGVPVVGEGPMVRIRLPPAVSQVRTAIGPPELSVAPRKQAQAPSPTGGPRVRIHLPPAASHVRTRFAEKVAKLSTSLF